MLLKMAYEEYVDFFMEDSSLQTPIIAMHFVTEEPFDLDELRRIARLLPYNESKWYMAVYHYVFTRSPRLPLREKCRHEVQMRRSWRNFQESFSYVVQARELTDSGEPEVPPLPC